MSWRTRLLLAAGTSALLAALPALGQDTSAPYSYTWRNVPPGSHVLTARATDNLGAATTSSPVGITVRPKR